MRTVQIIAALVTLAPLGALAGPKPDSGRLIATAGVSQTEGQAGGGLVPWAVIGGYGTDASWGANVFTTQLRLSDYDMTSRGGAVGVANRVEFSIAEHSFALNETGAALGLGEDFRLEQHVYGAKLRLLGHLIADQGTPIPQVSLGFQHKRARRGELLEAIGAGDDEGTDVTLSASKLFLAQSLLVNGTLRYTNANQLGLMGFGGDREADRTLHPEASIAYLLSRHIAVGAEYRSKPDNLSFAREDDALSAFVAYLPSKHVSITGAVVDLGSIGGEDDQRGAYLSIQAGF